MYTLYPLCYTIRKLNTRLFSVIKFMVCKKAKVITDYMSDIMLKKYTEGIFHEQTELVTDFFNTLKSYPEVVQWWAAAPELGRLIRKSKTKECAVLASVYGTWLGIYTYEDTIDDVVLKALQRS